MEACIAFNAFELSSLPASQPPSLKLIEHKKGLAKMANPFLFDGAGGRNRTDMDARSAGF